MLVFFFVKVKVILQRVTNLRKSLFIRVRVKKSLIEGILDMYLFRVYDFNSFFLVGALLSFFPSFYYQSVRVTTTRRPLNNNDDGRLLKSAFVSFQQKRLVVIL